jgi:hypothetical protein|tara:strand:+ start:769 stop:1116 length:348 start_codon:yes stop_codon:yes gene_type:complete
MAYQREELITKSLDAIKKHNILFIRDIFTFTSFQKSTFYSHGLEKEDTIKDALTDNRVNMKMELRAKWYASDNATLQVCLMKLIADEDEAHRLNGTKREIKDTTVDKEININIRR